MRKPSRKTFEEAFPGKGAILRKVLDNNRAWLLENFLCAREQEKESFGPPWTSSLRMTVFNEILEGYGIEFAEHRHSAKSFDYVNMGDAYTTTIVRFTSGKYAVAAWGDIVEKGGYK